MEDIGELEGLRGEDVLELVSGDRVAESLVDASFESWNLLYASELYSSFLDKRKSFRSRP